MREMFEDMSRRLRSLDKLPEPLRIRPIGRKFHGNRPFVEDNQTSKTIMNKECC